MTDASEIKASAERVGDLAGGETMERDLAIVRALLMLTEAVDGLRSRMDALEAEHGAGDCVYSGDGCSCCDWTGVVEIDGMVMDCHCVAGMCDE